MIQGYTLATFPKVAQYILCTTREETGKRTLQIQYTQIAHGINSILDNHQQIKASKLIV